MRSCIVYTTVLLLVLTQSGTAQDGVEEQIKRAVKRTATAATAAAQDTVKQEIKRAVNRAGKTKADVPQIKQLKSTPGPNIQLDVLCACVVFDKKGELRVEKEGAEPEVNRVGTIGANLAAKLNEERGGLAEGVSSATAGANLLLQGLADGGSLQNLSRLQLRMPLDGGKARLQRAYRRPRVTGVILRGDARTNSIELENVGTLVETSAQSTDSGKIGLNLSIEQSELGPQEEGELVAKIGDAEVRTPTVNTTIVETQIVVGDGETVVAASFVMSSEDRVKETFVLVTPTLLQ